ncbi:MAG: PilC/PilY family type IV pilus protein, partial [Sedimenticolaceae bacterium]
SWGINTFNNGSCTNWGNPQSEIYLETLRYFAGDGNGPDSGFEANDDTYLPGLVTASTWNDPLGPANYCAPVNVIQFNASVASYDGEMGGASDLDGSPNVSTWTNAVGGHEGINGNDYFVGGVIASNNGLCTGKTVPTLSEAVGICPEAPRLEGDYDIAGLAYYANTTSIRDDITDADANPVDINVKTFGVTLAPAVPKIEVIRAGSTDPEDVVAVILPACRNDSVDGNCAIVDFKVVQKQTETSPGSGQYRGRYYVNWEDSEQGGDYDQDMAGMLEYTVTGSLLTVTTRAIGQSTPYRMGFGYILAGTDTDGFHVHSGINGFDEVVDTSGSPTCSDAGISCVNRAPATSVTYTLDASAAGLLPDPLLLAAKYGGFEEDDLDVANGGNRPVGAAAPNSIPDQDYEWKDTATGLPDTYFYATNPAELEQSLSNVFLEASKDTSSASSTAANSQRVSTDTTIFQARFDSTDWSGELLAFPVIESTGALSLTAAWDAGEKLEGVAAAARTILTNNAGTGVTFEWDSLSDPQKALLNIDPDNLAADTLGTDRVLYLRGVRTGEVQNGGVFRDRSRKLGDLVNSSPAYVGELPGFAYPNWLERYEDTSNPTTLTDPSAESYSEFITRMGGRDSMLYVGGNDGMLHGFTATPDASLGGIEKVAFVPNALYPTLNQLTSPDYAHRYYVDGTPTFGDVMFADHYWHTILVGGLNGGGRGIYALDVTDPDFGTLMPSAVFLWEIETTTGGNFDDLGFTYSRPSVVKNHSGSNAFTYDSTEGEWVVVFGNGYASASGNAVLY